MNDTLQSRCNDLAPKLRKIADALEYEVATVPENIEGCNCLENVLKLTGLAQKWIDWYRAED